MRNRILCKLNVARRRARGFTLIELLLAIGILTMCVVALGMMARAVEISTEFNQGYGTAALHAQVAFDRISRAVTGASNNATYAGAWVTQDTVSSWTFPDTLIVWRPSSGTPANSQGAPLASELVLFCPDPSAPNQLVEITVPTDTSTLPSPTNASTFKTYIDGLKTESGVQKTLLTDLIRTATDSANTLRGCVRFAVTLNPSDVDIASYRAGTMTWANVPWAQGIWSVNIGMRQVWVRTELQMMPSGSSLVTKSTGMQPVPFFGSATYSCEVLP
jgi:prepilin-type N-terminal cleavage/methylation domain-containing protein